VAHDRFVKLFLAARDCIGLFTNSVIQNPHSFQDVAFRHMIHLTKEQREGVQELEGELRKANHEVSRAIAVVDVRVCREKTTQL
jgi:hypothetical protein